MIITNDGKIQPVGKVTKTLIGNCIYEKPGFLEAVGNSGYSYTHENPATESARGGFIRLKTGENGGDRAILRTTFPVHLKGVEEIRLEVNGIRGNQTSQIGFGVAPIPLDNAEDAGVVFWNDKVRFYQSDGDFNAKEPKVEWLSEQPRLYNFTFIVRPKKQEVILLQNDQIVALYHEEFNTETEHEVYPKISISYNEDAITNSDDNAGMIWISQVKVSLSHL